MVAEIKDTEMSTVEELRRRNTELEKEVTERKEREEGLRKELERTRERLAMVEEAEERLSVELTELEADAVETVSEYNLHIKSLVEQLNTARAILSVTGIPRNLAAVAGGSNQYPCNLAYMK